MYEPGDEGKIIPFMGIKNNRGTIQFVFMNAHRIYLKENEQMINYLYTQ